MNKKVVLEEDLLSMQTCSSQSKVELKDAICLFCDKSTGSEGLHNASTHDIDRKAHSTELSIS